MGTPSQIPEAAIIEAIHRRNLAWSEARAAHRRAQESLERFSYAVCDEHMARLRDRGSRGGRRLAAVYAAKGRQALDGMYSAEEALFAACEAAMAADREVRRLLTEAGR